MKIIRKSHVQHLGGLSNINIQSVLSSGKFPPIFLNHLFSLGSVLPGEVLIDDYYAIQLYPPDSCIFPNTFYFLVLLYHVLRDTYPVFVHSTTQPFQWVYCYNHIINVPEPQLQFYSSSLCACSWIFSKNTIQFLTFYVAYNFILFPQELALLEFWSLSFLPLLFLFWMKVLS